MPYAVRICNQSESLFRAKIKGSGFFQFGAHHFEIRPNQQVLAKYSETCEYTFKLWLFLDDDSELYTAKVESWYELVIDANHKISENHPKNDGQLVVAGDSEKRRRESLIAILKKANHFSVLNLPEDASPDLIKKVYRRLACLHHPDHNENSVESKIIFQKLSESYQILSDPETVAQYRRLLVFQRGPCHLEYWKQAFWNDPGARKRAGGCIFLVVLGVAGTVATVATAGTALPFVFVGLGLSGSALASGIGGLNYLRSRDAVVFGIDDKQLKKVLATHATMGLGVGALTGGVGATLPSLILREITSELVGTIASGAASGAVDGIAWGAGSKLANVLGNDAWNGMDAVDCCKDMALSITTGLAGGAVGGLAGGAIAGASGQIGTAGTAADEILAIAGQKVAKPVGRAAAKVITENAISAYPDAQRVDHAEDLLKIGENNRESGGGEDSGEGGASGEGTGRDSAIPVYFSLTFVNEAWTRSRMIVEYTPENETKSTSRFLDVKTMVIGHGETKRVDERSRRFRVRFETSVLFTWKSVKKYDRIHRKWISPTEDEIICFDNPESYTFVLRGTAGLEAVMEIRDETQNLV